MRIIIDGYNILKQVYSGLIVEPQRRAFISLLGKYATNKNHTIIVVFDGGESAWLTREKDHGITIFYSGFKQNADTVIMEYAEKYAYNALLISSDNAIKAFAQKHRCTVMDSMVFYEMVKQTLTPKTNKKLTASLVKTTLDNNPLVDALMHADTQPIMQKDESYAEKRSSKSYTDSKEERIYKRKIKKL